MAGPFHSALGEFSGKGPSDEEWKWGVESMQEVAEHAAKVNVTLGLEYLNRFECYFLNTAVDGARFVKDVNHPNCGMMYDTFHAHIEEKNVGDAVRALKDCLVHVHISEKRPQYAGPRATFAGTPTSTPSRRSVSTISW